MNAKVSVLSILIGLSLFVALILESRMTTGHIGELVLIILGIFFMTVILFGLWIEANWGYSLGLLLFAVSLANLVWLFFNTQAFLTFAFGLLVNVAGLVICLASLEKSMPWEELETYEVNDKKRKN